MRHLSWIIGLALLFLVACGVEPTSIGTPQEVALQSAAQASGATPPASDLASEPVEITSCFSVCLSDCLESMGCSSLPPDQQQDCGNICGEGCRCLCGPPSACP
jgi:hypothetical protein